MADPFAVAGFAPQADQPQATVNPFGAAGFAPVAVAPVAQAAPLSQPIGVTDMGAPIFADDAANREVQGGSAQLGRKFMEGATFGLSPFAEAGARSVAGGVPYSEALKDTRAASAATQEEHPWMSLGASAAGSVAPTSLAFRLAAPLAAGARTVLPRVGAGLVDTLVGGGVGAGTAAGNDIGSGHTDDIGSDAAFGGLAGAGLSAVAPVIGRALQAAPNMVRGAYNGVRNIFTDAGKDAVAGNVLREAGGDFANSAARSPIPDLELRTSQATGNPGLSALERTLASEPGGQAGAAGDLVNNGRTPNQTNAVARSLVGPDAGIEPTVLTNQNSARGTQAIQDARAELKAHETGLWNTPELQGMTFPRTWVVNGVNDDIKAMPPSFRMAIADKMGGLVADLGEGAKAATIPDINAVRSRALEVARGARATGDTTTAAAAGALADSLLDRIGVAAGQKGARALADYKAARAFTGQRAAAFGHPEFDAILRPNSAGNMRANDETTFGRFFDTTGGTDTGLQKLQTVSDMLRQTGRGAKADEFDQAARDYLKSAVLRESRKGSGLNATGAPTMNPSTLASTANKVAPAASGVPMVAPVAGDIQAAGNAAELLDRPNTLRGDANSTTYEKLRNRDLVSAILGQSGSSGVGAVAGGYAGGKYGSDAGLPWYLGVPGGMLAGALAGRQAGPFIGKAIGGNPITSGIVKGPTEDIIRRVQSGLASPAEYSRLMQTLLHTGPDVFDPGRVSAALPPGAVRALIPSVTGEGGR